MPYMAFLIQHGECQQPATPRRGEGAQTFTHTRGRRVKDAREVVVEHEVIRAFAKTITRFYGFDIVASNKTLSPDISGAYGPFSPSTCCNPCF
ncbi:hypothetical protein RWK44_05250 [Rhizobium sp. 25PS6]|uniref:hypothetical protein n=1 Tax=Rhizobium sp. 25PS6 TaxID=3075622 RepID=UPI0028FD1163|nr:hypothetical protein [Rhizobium sp. 25PS6]MDU0359817.1 hypothetical protein [Rhizobium sp. 25PS6]